MVAIADMTTNLFVIIDIFFPRQRLRCGSIGRKVRDDPAENGLTGITQMISSLLQFQCQQNDQSAGAHVIECVKNEENFPTTRRTVFENGLSLHSHAATAPEETAFLFQEIFLNHTYLRHGITLCAGDLVVDVGENMYHMW